MPYLTCSIPCDVTKEHRNYDAERWCGYVEDVTLIDRIQKEMLSDDEDRKKQSDYLRFAYENAPEEAKKAIDWCFIALCGWSLKTLLEW